MTGSRRRWTSGALALALLATACLVALAQPVDALAEKGERGAADGKGRGVVELPVSFRVTNQNRSEVPCAPGPDGRRYEVNGHLVAPRSALRGRNSRAVALYLNGLAYGEFFFRFQGFPRYDYAIKLARLGHASVVVDRLGYDSSGKPAGTRSCNGSQADIAHQIVGKLRSGKYSAGRGRGQRFRKVVLGGHSAGGAIAQIEAYSFDDIDGLIVMSYADQAQSPLALSTLTETSLLCGTDPERAEGDSGPSGYRFFGKTPQDFREGHLFEPGIRNGVADRVTALRNRDPCGDVMSFAQTPPANTAGVRSISVPVLLLYGNQDAFFGPASASAQRSLYTGSDDVTLERFERTGHAITLHRSAPKVRATVSDWLAEHGFGATRGSRGGNGPGDSGGDRRAR